MMPGHLAQWERDFAASYARRWPDLVRCAAKYLPGDRGGAEDCVQVAAAGIWAHRTRYARRYRLPLPLLFGAIRNAALNEVRRQQRATRRGDAMQLAVARAQPRSPEVEVEFALKDELTRTIHRDLTSDERVVFWHVVIRECSADEAAELIGVTVKTVQNRLSAVRAKIATALSISRVPRREVAPR